MFKSDFSLRGGKYIWTLHSRFKMKYYNVSESRVKRIINAPQRYEEGIVPNTIAVMQPASTKKYSEIWVMYKIVDTFEKTLKNKIKNGNPIKIKAKAFKIITVWRYPGKSPKRNPIPQDVLEEVKNLLD
jgi:hypothetical protein